MPNKQTGLYTPIKRMLEESTKKYVNNSISSGNESQSNTNDFIEGVTLHRSENGRVIILEGDDVENATITYDENGFVSTVEEENKEKNSLIEWSFIYDDESLLERVEPNILSEGYDEEDEDDDTEVFEPDTGEDLTDDEIDLNPIVDDDDNDFVDDDNEEI